MHDKRKFKILMGIPAPWLKGGPPTHLPYLVEYFEELQDFNIKTFYYGSKKNGKEILLGKLLRTFFNIGQYIILIIYYKPDLIHLNSAFGKLSILRDTAFALVSKIFGKKIFFKIHGSHYDLLFTQNFIYLKLIKIYFWSVHKIGVLSEIERMEFIRQFGNDKKIVVVKNIIIECKAIDGVPVFKKEIDKCYGLYLSRIEEHKGLEDVLNATLIIINSLPNFRLIIVGDGSKLKWYQEYAQNKNLNDYIIWTGYVENSKLSIIYKNVDFYIFSSHFPEGMPMSLMGALSAGLPIISTKVRFVSSYMIEDENYLSIEPDNPKLISEKVFSIFANKIKIEEMRSRNIDFIKAYSKDNVGKEFVKIYKEMLM
jgi:glycosyltransferase involved in cell wall biosynthesis